MYTQISLAIASILFLSQSLFAQDNLITNGQFIKGTAGWQVLLNDANQPIKAHTEQSASYQEYGLADNFIGVNFVELDEKSAIQQKIKTTKGDVHMLSFAYAHRPGAGKKQLIVAVNGKAVYTKTVNNSDDTRTFQYKSVLFEATNSETRIAFYTVSLGCDEDKGVLLTDIKCHEPNETDLEKHKRAVKY